MTQAVFLKRYELGGENGDGGEDVGGWGVVWGDLKGILPDYITNALKASSR